MATVTSMLSDITQPAFPARVDQLMLDSSNFFKKLLKSSSGVVWGDPEVGRDWEAKRAFWTGLGGALEQSGVTGPDISTVGAFAGFNVPQKVETWPGLGESAMPAYVTQTVSLIRTKFALYVPILVLKLAAMRAHIGNHMERAITASGKHVVYYRANWFLAGSYNEIGSFTTGGGGATISNTGTQVTLDSGSSIRRFARGLSVDIFETGTNTRLNSQPVFVGPVDAYGTAASPITTGGGKVYLFQVGAATTVLGATTQYDIVLRNSGRELATWPAVSARAPNNLSSIIVDSGSVFGLDVGTQYPEFKSLVRDLGGKVLTGGQLMPLVAHMLHAKSDVEGIDSLWAPAGVWASYFNALNTEFVWDRSNGLVTVSEGFNKGAGYGYEGNRFPYMTDPWLPEKTVFGLRTKNNWTLLVPPKYPKTVANGRIGGDIEFMKPLLHGGSDIFENYTKVGGADAGATTDHIVAYGESWWNIVPEDISGLKLTDVNQLYA